MKTAVASPDEGPDKKKYGIPPKDKKGLGKKTEYEYKSESIKKRKPDSSQKKEDPDYEKFKKDYKAPNGRYNGYKAPDGSWHGSPGDESAIKAHYKWSKMSRDERDKVRDRNERNRQMSGSKISMPKDKDRPTKPDPKSPEAQKSAELKKKLEMRRNEMRKASPTIKKDYKVVENKIKKPEDKEKEKSNKLRRTASRSKTSIRMKKKAK